MIVITGSKIQTSWGLYIIADSFSGKASVGDAIEFENQEYIIKAVTPSSKPPEKWSIEVEPVADGRVMGGIAIAE